VAQAPLTSCYTIAHIYTPGPFFIWLYFDSITEMVVCLFANEAAVSFSLGGFSLARMKLVLTYSCMMKPILLSRQIVPESTSTCNPHDFSSTVTLKHSVGTLSLLDSL
jgi:hypothetical protein